MAEKLPLFELEIDLAKATADVRSTKIAIQQLTEESEKLKDAEGELSDEYLESQAALKTLKTELRANEKITQNVISANNANTGSIEQQRKQLAIVSAQWAKLSKDERENTEQGKLLTKQKLQLTNALKKEERATGDARRNVGNYNEGVGNSIGLLGQFVPVVGRATTGLKALGKAFTLALGPIGLVIAAIALVVGGLKAFFTSSEEGQDAWDRFGSTADVVLGNISDALSEFGKKLQDPKKSLEELSTFFEDTFGTFWEGMLDGAIESFRKFGNTLNLQFQRVKDIFTENAKGIEQAQKDIAENNKKIAEANQKVIEGANNTAEAYENAKNKVKEFNEETLREIEIAQKLADKQASLNKQIRFSIVANARDLEQVAKLRNQVAQKENFDNQERLKFLDQAIALEEKILKRNLSIAQQKAFIKSEQNKLSNSTREDLDEEAKLRADIFNVRRANFEKTRKLEIERAALTKLIRTEQRKNAEKDKVDFEADLLEQAMLAEQALKDEIEINKQVAESRRSQKEQEKAQRQIELDAEFEATRANLFATLDLEAEKLEIQKEQELEFARSIGAETLNIEKKFINASLELEKTKQDTKLALAQDFARNVATIFGAQTAVGKAAAIAETTINTYRSATASYSALAGIPYVGPVLGFAAAAAAVTAGLINVKKILSVKSGLPGDTAVSASVPTGGGTSSTSAPVRPESVAPAINEGIISRDTITQAAETPEAQTTLVVDEVTAKQSVQSSNEVTATI
jgi:hypothetical protein